MSSSLSGRRAPPLPRYGGRAGRHGGPRPERAPRRLARQTAFGEIRQHDLAPVLIAVRRARERGEVERRARGVVARGRVDEEHDPAAPGVQIIVTSQAPLDLRAEWLLSATYRRNFSRHIGQAGLEQAKTAALNICGKPARHEHGADAGVVGGGGQIDTLLGGTGGGYQYGGAGDDSLAGNGGDADSPA